MNSAEYLADSPYARFGDLAIDAPVDARKAFIRKTYAHLTAAIYGLVLIEFLYFKTLDLDNLVPRLFAERWGWLALFGGYMLIWCIARKAICRVGHIRVCLLGHPVPHAVDCK